MKKIIVIIFILCVSANANAQGYKITGNVKGLENGTIELKKKANGKQLNRTEVKNGIFTFIETSKFLGDYCYIQQIGSNLRIDVFIEPGEIKIVGDASQSSKISVTGTPSNDAYMAYNRDVFPIESRINEIRILMKNNRNQKLVEELDNLYSNKFYPLRREYAKKYNNTILAPLFLSAGIGGLQYKEIDAIIKGFAPNAPQNWYTDCLKDRRNILEHTQIGATIPDFTLKTPEGKKLTLSDLRGSYVYLDVWASWCSPCRVENKNLVIAYNQYHEKGFTVLSLSIDEDKEKWMQAIEEDKLPWNNHVSSLVGWECPVARLVGCAYGMSGIPYTILLDREGKAIGHNFRGDELLKKLEEIFRL